MQNLLVGHEQHLTVGFGDHRDRAFGAAAAEYIAKQAARLHQGDGHAAAVRRVFYRLHLTGQHNAHISHLVAGKQMCIRDRFTRYGLTHDPYYNPSLTLDREDFSESADLRNLKDPQSAL